MQLPHPQGQSRGDQDTNTTHLSLQNSLKFSVVLAAPLILANRILTPASPTPQNELQKSLEGIPLYGSTPGDFATAYFDRDETED
jgi:hypothetical protein